jgi:hypothetical protein
MAAEVMANGSIMNFAENAASALSVMEAGGIITEAVSPLNAAADWPHRNGLKT